MRETLGFVGLGQMGQPIATRLLQTGNRELCVFDLQQERVAPLAALGAIQAEHLADVAPPGGVVVSMVPNDQALLQIAVGEGGLLYRLGKGGLHVSLSTISPLVALELTRLYARHGCAFLAATVLGRPAVAERGELTVMVSGETGAKQRVWPLLHAVGTQVHDLGAHVEAAVIAKIATNFLIGAAIEAQGEAAALVEAYGLERAAFLRMVSASALFDGAVYQGYGQMIGARDFSEARFPVPLGLKDIQLVRTAADRVGMRLAYTDPLLEHLQAALDAGRGAEDWSVLSAFVPAPVGPAWAEQG